MLRSDSLVPLPLSSVTRTLILPTPPCRNGVLEVSFSPSNRMRYVPGYALCQRRAARPSEASSDQLIRFLFGGACVRVVASVAGDHGPRLGESTLP